MIRWQSVLIGCILGGLLCCGEGQGQEEIDVSPPGEKGKPPRVEVGIFVLDVDTIDTVNQSFEANVFVLCRWKDPRLAHNAGQRITKPLTQVWHPRLFFANQQRLWPSFPEVVTIRPDGTVSYRQRVWGNFSQPLRLRDFPFDRQTFTIQLASGGYSTDELELVCLAGNKHGIASALSVPDWDLTKWQVHAQPYTPVPGEPGVAGFAFTFKMERRVGYYVIKVIIPLILIVAMSWAVFWIDPKEAGTNISVSVTAMLTLIAYRFAVGNSLPDISYLTRLDYFILGSTIIVFCSLVQVVLTNTLVNKGELERARKLDRWSRLIYPLAFVLVCFESLVFRFGL